MLDRDGGVFWTAPVESLAQKTCGSFAVHARATITFAVILQLETLFSSPETRNPKPPEMVATITFAVSPENPKLQILSTHSRSYTLRPNPQRPTLNP